MEVLDGEPLFYAVARLTDTIWLASKPFRARLAGAVGLSTGSDSDRVGTHASGVLAVRSIASWIARQRRAYPVAIAPGTDLITQEHTDHDPSLLIPDRFAYICRTQKIRRPFYEILFGYR